MVVLGLTAENHHSLLVCWFGYKLRWPSFPTDILLFYLTDIPLSMFTEQESTFAQKLIFKRVRIGIHIIRCAGIMLL